MSLDDLVSAIPDRSGRTVALGEVTAASPLKVRFAGTAAADAVEGVQVVGSYAPTVGDRVVLLKVGAAWVVLGSPDAGGVMDHTHTADDTGWADLPLEGGFNHYGAPWGTAKYRKVDGVVHLRGLVKDGAIDTVAFTLPVGFRPVTNLITPCLAANNTGVGHLRIHNNGACVFQNEGVFSTGWMSVSVAPFLAEQ